MSVLNSFLSGSVTGAHMTSALMNSYTYLFKVVNFVLNLISYRVCHPLPKHTISRKNNMSVVSLNAKLKYFS